MSELEQTIDIDAPAANDDSAELNAEIDAILAQSGEVVEVEQASEPDIATSDVLMGFVAPAFDILAPNWDVSGSEKKALCDVYGQLIDKYFPDGALNNFGAEIAAIGVTVTILQSRIGKPRKKPKEKPKETEQEAANDPLGGLEIAS